MSDINKEPDDFICIDERRIPERYRSEIVFLTKILKNYPIAACVFEQADRVHKMVLGAYSIFHGKELAIEALNKFASTAQPNIIYRLQSHFHYQYLFLMLPDTESPCYMLVGPYICNDVTKQMLLEICELYHVPAEYFPNLEKFYKNLPLLSNESILLSIVNSLGELMWNGIDNFHIVDVNGFMSENLEPVAARPLFKEPEEAFMTMEILERRYAFENELMLAVSQGQTHKAEQLIAHFSSRKMENRQADPVRDSKNYSIILNTLLRKSAENGSVHPLHIDSLSSRYARKIEQITSVSAGDALQNEMVRKYCLLVKNHSMKNYSLLIRKVLTRIDSDLTADLTLKAQAELLKVNASYLSSLFKKETGMTLTEYVNRKRVEHAIFLLNSTSMQIQTIAEYCGIPDVNYFTKMFKKIIGKTPKEYRDGISV